MIGEPFTPQVSQATARRILAQLRIGQPPHEDVSVINVGYDALLEWFRVKLDEIRQYGASDVKFISADYGRGKTHFLDLVRLLAFERGFVVSRVELNQRDVPFDRLETVLQRVTANIETKKFRSNGFQGILQDWARRRKQTPEHQVYDALRELTLPDMQLNLVRYWKAANATPPDHGMMLGLMNWFQGQGSPRQRVPNVLQYMGDLTRYFRSIDYSGLLIMVDEAESISSLSRGTRGETANENIRQIIDNVQESDGFYFLFASTPLFFEAPPGGQPRPGDPVSIYSYPALRRRLENQLGLMPLSSPDSVIVELPELSTDDFKRLTRKLRELSIIAHGDPTIPVTDSQLDSLVRYVQQSDPRIATLVRSTVAVLDRARTPGFAFEDEFEFIVEREREQLARAQSG